MCKFSRQIILFTLLFLRLTLNAQNIGINDNGATPNINAILDVDVTTNNKGILIPRLTTAERTAIAGLGVGDEALTVYDTTTDSYWLWDGTQWVEFTMSGKAWELTGNTGTTAGTDFIGTTDAVDWVAKTDNVERMRVLSTGEVGIGTATPRAGFPLDVNKKMVVSRYGTNPIITTARANGAYGAETQLVLNDQLNSINMQAWNGAGGWITLNRIYARTVENHSTTAMGTQLYFQTTKIGTTSPTDVVTIDDEGRLGVGNITPNTSSLGDFTSTDKGFLVPRMTSVQKLAIAAPATGLLIYQTDGSKAFYYYDGTAWVPLLGSSATGFGGWTLTGNTGTTAGTNFIGTTDAVDWVVKTNNTERLRVLSDGKVGVGTTSPAVHLEVAGTDLATSTIRSATYSANGQPAYYMFRKSRNATIGSHTILQDNDFIGSIRFAGSDGSGFLVGASIQGRVDGTPGVGSVPAEIAFQTSSTDKMVIRNSGMVGIGISSPAARLQVAASSGENGLRVQINSSTKLYTTSNGGTSIGAFTAATTNGLRVAGDANIVGTLSKGAGTFKIDHPLDPENKYLYHSFVESPDMMNIYNGNIVTDANGDAIVKLPDYFEALNMEFRYQLTVIGSFAQAIISKEVAGNKFKIKTSDPNIKVSWQVTGVRQDPYANQNRVVPEVEKENELKGYYLHPSSYGYSEQKSISNAKEEINEKEIKDAKIREDDEGENLIKK